MDMYRRRLLQSLAVASAAPLCAPHVARAAGRKLRIGHNNSPTSALNFGSVAFQAYVAEKTDGRYQVEIFPSAQFGNDIQLIKAVSDGTLDMTISATSVLGLQHTDLELAELPYLFKDQASARKAMAGDMGAYFAGLLEKSSLSAVGWGENGLRHITSNRPIRTVADLKGLKIRVQPSKAQVESFNGMGAVAAPLTFNELAEALRTGRFEAQENPLGIVTSNDFIPKYQTHLSLTGHVYSPFAILFSSDVLEEMPGPDREVIRAGGRLAAKTTLDFNDNAVATGLEKLRSGGMTIVTDVDRAGFQTAMDGLTDRLAGILGKEAILRVRGLIS